MAELAREAVVHTLIAALMTEAVLRLWRASLELQLRMRVVVVGLACLAPPLFLALAPVRASPAFLDHWALLVTERWTEAQLLGLGTGWLWAPVAGAGCLLLGLDLVPWLRDRGARPPPAPTPSGLADTVARLAQALGLRPPLVEVVDVPAPLLYCRGVRRPRVVLSTGTLALLDGRQLEGALAHELVHLQRGDVLLGWVLLGARVLQAFNPAVQVLARAIALDAEERADAGAARVTGRPAALASALVTMFKATGSHGATSEVLLGAALARALEANIASRCRRLLEPPPAPEPGLDAARLAMGTLAVSAVLFLVT